MVVGVLLLIATIASWHLLLHNLSNVEACVGDLYTSTLEC